jgi:hypothetical protein
VTEDTGGQKDSGRLRGVGGWSDTLGGIVAHRGNGKGELRSREKEQERAYSPQVSILDWV